MTVDIRRVENVAFVTLNNPPVNAIGLAVRQGLAKALDWAEKETGLTQVVLTGAGRAFAAGGDAREFDAPPVEPHLPDLVNRIEASRVPWVAAINGVALGGGCELALGCRYRIAAPGQSIGLPEVGLGVIPGATGTQRLPRLIGMAAALDLIATGKPTTSENALKLGLIDEIAADPVAAAASPDPAVLDGRIPVGKLPAPTTDETALNEAHAKATKSSRGQIAPHRAIDLIALSATTPLEQALVQERQTFLDLRSGDQALALRHAFFAERAAKAPEWLKAEPVDVKHVAVVGGGTMGSGIAYALLNAGLRVTILETDSGAVERARQNVEKIIEASQKRGLIDDAGAIDRRARFDASSDYSAARDAELAIEAAFESMEVKKTVFAALEATLPPNAVLATNTSYLDINEIAEVLGDPSRLLGLHFFAPAHIMKLLEIVRGDHSSDVALATGFALGKRLRKIPVLSGVCDGFIGNRILARYREAADSLLMDGTNPWELDEAMVEFGYAMGVYETQDLSGLDIGFANRRRQDATRDPNRRYVPISDRMVQEGRLGRKTGVGWYRYPGGGGKVVDPLVEDLIREEAHFAKVARREISSDEIRETLLLAMINEAAAILDEGIAETATDIDLVTLFGYGFPRWRGGLMHYADTLGAAHIVAGLRRLAEDDPVIWTPCPLLIRAADQGISIAEAAQRKKSN